MKTNNRYEIQGLVSKVYFNNGKYFLCDTDDLEYLLEGHTWRFHKGYAYSKIDGKCIAAHQFLLGKLPGYEIDHKNRNKLDNRRVNLRQVVHAVNTRNIDVVYTDLVGVYPSKYGNRYKAVIHCNGKTIYLGTFDTQNEAIQARKKAEVFYWS